MSRVTDIPTSRLRNFIDFHKDPISFLVRMLQLGDVVSLRTGFKPSYVVNSHEFVQEVLVTKDSFFRKGRTNEVLRRTIGEGLLTAEKEEYERQKRYHQPLFYKERLQSYARTVVEETEKVVRTLEHKSTCSLHHEMMQLTLSIIAKTMFATDLEENKKELAAAVSDTIEQTARTLFSPILWPLAIPTKGHRIHKKAINKLEQMVYGVIQEAKKDRERYHMTMLGMLLDTVQESGEPISDEEIRDQMMTMLLAGHETSANLLTWIFYALDKSPEVEQRFHQEIDQINFLEQMPFEVYRGLEYTHHIIQEALRLYPPAWLIYREADQDVELLGEPFTKGSTFMISPYSLHRKADVFGDPEVFRPERFAESTAAPWPKFAYFPFGGGSRGCIGSKFALLETALVLTVLGKSYKFRCIDDRQAVPEPLVSLRIKGGLSMKVIPR
jgi:cytochrome P450